MTDIHWQDHEGDALNSPQDSMDPPSPPRDVVRGLDVLAPLVQFGTIAIGVIYALESISLLLNDSAPLSSASRMALRVNILTVLLLYSLVGVVAGRLLSAVARLLEMQRAQSATAARTALWCERTLEPALIRLAEALERAGPGVGTAAPAGGAAEDLGALRQAIAAHDWAEAEQRVRDFVVAYPGHPEAARLAGDLAQGRDAATHDLLARLDAARAAGDADRVLELREALSLLLTGEPLRALDRDLGKWFLHVIQKRLRAGAIAPDIPLLAARVADALDTTPEGASLRASLPTLRRSAGLCARCAEPYTGVAAACPKCLAATVLTPTPPSSAAPDEEIAHEDEDIQNMNGRADDPFLRDESV